MWHFEDILKATNGRLVKLEKEVFNRISCDSRTIREGEFFIPLKGKKYDAHFFIKDALAKSKAGTLCEKEKLDLISDLNATIIAVDDTNKALMELASYRRRNMKSTFIAITGSCGKTTTKEALVHILKKEKTVAYNEKNYNNLFGVPLSIISVEGDPELCVYELGTNSFGEIKALTKIVDPHISAITNILPTHLEGLKSIYGVKNEKLDLFRYTRDDGIILINTDDEHIRYFSPENKRGFSFGIKNRAMFTLEIKKTCGWDGYEVILDLDGQRLTSKIRLLGMHNLYNVLLASSIAYICGINKERIKEAIEEFGPYPMRMYPRKSKNGYIVIDDTYNASPASMYEAIRTLSSLPCEGKKILVLGDMNELGDYSSSYHRELGKYVDEFDFDYIFFLGEKMREAFFEVKKRPVFHFEDKESLLSQLLPLLRQKDCVLVKGSRALNMEFIVEGIV